MAHASSSETDESPLCVVGIGASAGGLEAIGEMLVKLPDNTGMAFVIIQHLSPITKACFRKSSASTP